jgi:PadR family transcriptional regulator PadR
MRVTGPLLKVLRALLEDTSRDVYGLELVRATGVKSGTLYPLLDRLETDGLVTSRWEDADPHEVGRPRRRLYRLTGLGVHEARQVLLEHSLGSLRWA